MAQMDARRAKTGLCAPARMPPKNAALEPLVPWALSASEALPRTELRCLCSFTRSRLPTKKQQMKHAMTVQSAHMITTDYITLSQPLSEGLLLQDRTDRKLKLIHSLGELQPMHQYSTEYGNILERPTKHKAVLAGSIELEVTTDEVDFDAAMGRLALAADGTGSTSTEMHMAAYAAVRSGWAPAAAREEGSAGANGHGGSCGCSCSNGSSSGSGDRDGNGALPSDENASQRLREDEAMQRIAALVERLGEMEEWFRGVKAEAERERRMREQSAARLSIMQERVELLHSQLVETQRENKQLRERVADLCTANGLDDDDDDDASVYGRSTARSVSGDSVRSGSICGRVPMQGFGSSSASGRASVTKLKHFRGPLNR